MSTDTTKHKLVLVKLTKKQIAEAEKVNGDRKTFTHAVLCGPWGQILGTETHCRKYYDAWKRIFPLLFDGHMERSRYQVDNYETTFGLVDVLLAESQKRERAANPVWQDIERRKKVRDARAAHQAMMSKSAKHKPWTGIAIFALTLLLLAGLALAEPQSQDLSASLRSVGITKAMASKCAQWGQIDGADYANFAKNADAYAKRIAGKQYDSRVILGGFQDALWAADNDRTFREAISGRFCDGVRWGAPLYEDIWNL